VDQSNNKVVAGETYPTRFGSFGLSMIFFPNSRLHTACGARMATDILELWQKTLLEDPIQQLFLQVLAHPDVSFAQGSHERRDVGEVIERNDVVEALLAFDAGGGKTFPSYFWEKAQVIRAEMAAAPMKQKSATLERHLSDLEKFLAREDSEDREEWGMGIRQIEANYRNYLARVKSGLEKRAEELTNDPRFGVAYTLSLLLQLKAVLHGEHYEYIPFFNEAIATWLDETQDYSSQLDQLKLDIFRHEHQILFRTEDVRRDMELLVGDQDGADEDTGVLYNYLFARVMKQVAKRGKRVCEEIDALLGKADVTGKGLLGRYYNLLAEFERLKDKLRAKAKYFAKEQRSELLISLYKEEDFETWYRRWMGDDEERSEILRAVGNQLLLKVFHVESVTAAVAHIQRTPIDEIEGGILAECKGYFEGQEEQPEVLNLLLSGERLSPKARDEMIRRAYNLGKVWLKASEMGLEHVNPAPPIPDQRPCLIGVDTSNIPRLEAFKAIVKEIQLPGDSPPAFLNIGAANRGTIIFYNELGGVSAFYPSTVTQEAARGRGSDQIAEGLCSGQNPGAFESQRVERRIGSAYLPFHL